MGLWGGHAAVALGLCRLLAGGDVGGPAIRPSRFCEARHTECAVRPAAAEAAPSGRSAGGASASGSQRLAVLVTGQRSRFYPQWTFKHVVAPAAGEGYEVDYHAVLTLEASPEVGHNPWNSIWYRPVPNPAAVNLSAEALEDLVVRYGRHYGAHRVFFSTWREDAPLDPLPAGPGWRRGLLASSATSDAVRAVEHVRNLLRLKQWELLWNRTLATQALHGGYRHVLLVRDDLFWADDVHVRLFPDPRAVYSRPFGSLCTKEAAGVMEQDDKVLVLGGGAAGEMLALYTEYYHNPSPRLDTFDSFEHFLFLVALAKGLRWELVRKDWLPYFVAQHMWQPEWPEPRFCLRGVSRRQLEWPTGDCVHRSKVPFLLCDDFPLQ